MAAVDVDPSDGSSEDTQELLATLRSDCGSDGQVRADAEITEEEIAAVERSLDTGKKNKRVHVQTVSGPRKRSKRSNATATSPAAVTSPPAAKSKSKFATPPAAKGPPVKKVIVRYMPNGSESDATTEPELSPAKSISSSGSVTSCNPFNPADSHPSDANIYGVIQRGVKEMNEPDYVMHLCAVYDCKCKRHHFNGVWMKPKDPEEPWGEYYLEECTVRGKKCGNMVTLPNYAIIWQFKGVTVNLTAGTCVGHIGEDDWGRASEMLGEAAAEWIAYEDSPTI